MKPHLSPSTLLFGSLAVLLIVAIFFSLLFIARPGSRIPPDWVVKFERVIP